MEVVHAPTVQEIIHRARTKAETARRLLAIKRVKLAAAQTYSEKAVARAIQLRVLRGSI